MPLKYFDRVRETNSATGTSDFTLTGAVAGFLSFGDVLSNGDQIAYVAVAGSQFEVGIGTWNSSGDTITRPTTVEINSAGGTSKVSFSTAPEIFLSHIARKSRLPRMEAFSSSGTWYKDPAASLVIVEVINGGNGGGSGRRAASNASFSGGEGGAPGNLNWAFFAASELPNSVSVTVGAGGAGGAAVTADNTNGNAGSQSGVSSFGSYLVGPASNSSSPGLGGSGTGANGGGEIGAAADRIGPNIIPRGTFTLIKLGGTALISNGSPGAGAWWLPGGGGGGGGHAGSPTYYNGGAGGIGFQASTNTNTGGGGAGGTAGAAGSAGANGADESFGSAGGGGGGGGASAAAAGGNGGDGGTPGGGGGGGAASENGYNSGKGGDGGRGVVRAMQI